MTTTGVVLTHRTFHRSSPAGTFTVRPDVCDSCRGVVIAVRDRGLFTVDELKPHPDEPPTFGDLMARLGTPLQPPQRGLLDPTFRELAGWDRSS